MPRIERVEIWRSELGGRIQVVEVFSREGDSAAVGLVLSKILRHSVRILNRKCGHAKEKEAGERGDYQRVHSQKIKSGENG